MFEKIFMHQDDDFQDCVLTLHLHYPVGEDADAGERHYWSWCLSGEGWETDDYDIHPHPKSFDEAWARAQEEAAAYLEEMHGYDNMSMEERAATLEYWEAAGHSWAVDTDAAGIVVNPETSREAFEFYADNENVPEGDRDLYYAAWERGVGL